MPQKSRLVQDFSLEYKERLFMLWYQKSKPTHRKMYTTMPGNEDDIKPSQTTLGKWIEMWKERAQVMDEQVRQDLDDMMTAEKVKMLARHAVVGVEMQDRALEVLRDPDTKINSSTAVRLLVEGVEMERASRGVSTALQKVMDTSEEDLLIEVTDILDRADVRISQLHE